ncbi:MAG: hypothetical protein JWQ35_254 [Bacteriovoracaceae bacterium]|nr:hypothetical protein [Bacteriovoracaceae bacterium]
MNTKTKSFLSSLPKPSVKDGDGIKAEYSVTILKDASFIYSVWRNFENLPRFMKHLDEVQVLNDTRTLWRAKPFENLETEWETEMIAETPDEFISWRSIEGSEISIAGSVHFSPAPRGQGTQVTVRMMYGPPLGKITHVITKLTKADPHSLLREDMKRFKSYIETGDILSTEGQPRGQGIEYKKTA